MVKPQDFDSSTYFKVRVKNNLGTVFYSSMFTRASASTIGSASRHHHHRQQRQRRQCRQQMNLCIGQIEASTCPPPPGIPRAFDTFAVPGRREFDYQSLPGGGEFDPHALGVGNLNSTIEFM